MPGSNTYRSPIVRARLATPVSSPAPTLRPNAPATSVMTDLATEAPHVVAPERSIDEALREMIYFGVRLLLVAREHNVIGIVSSYDIMGERPIQFLHDPFKASVPHRHEDVRVEDVMTRIGDAEPLMYRWVAEASVAEIATLFRERPDMHLLVVENGAADGEVVVRGIFSRTRLERQLPGFAR